MSMKKQKGFIQIPLLIAIIVGVLVIGGGGYLGYTKFKSYQTNQIAKEKQIQESLKNQQELLKQQQEALEKAQQAVESTDASSTATVEELKKAIGILQNQPPKIIQKEIIKEVPSQVTPQATPQATKLDLPTIIAQWRPRIAYIECDFYANGAVLITQAGSGTMLQESNGGIILLTNSHVISYLHDYGADLCRSKLPGDNNIFTSSRDGIFGAKSGLDWGYLRVAPDEYLKNIPYRASIGCPTKPAVGDSIVILGYPGIGSKTDITATEGIISGYDGDYYITSAKVEHGNSGGAAILVKDNCYIGIPSFAEVGGVESLARILDLNAIK
ncbi:MAG: hypothetical protein A2815_00570 [Candidatus Portnoybacteria bacterium RIFCSPHIGHO2_01_FULL_40_12b]|uniref:Serine protease n=2 Tax=Candidatus Portnoyibacteriota TaxID=1817913 RepID=A0A1G2FC93_9BACT|nr:MAG: hypothetical protein A2815_00570 [Candidatus Portnoybacteria bacterium RIFCSPHIGHO2_01_FULL_40_12b]OGZ40274.1 MAG: hypothetical protein A3I20_02070 [Candidatus Portnoybacteria bacterium RIFCSPLOWO2_02_FULL_40_15]